VAEFRHPVQCCFVGLVPVSTALIGIAVRPHAPLIAGVLATLGIVGQLVAQMLLGYGVFHALLLIRLLPWIVRQPFAPAYWAFTFGLSAIATSFLRFAERGAHGPIAAAAPYFFVAVNLAIGGIAIGTLWLLLMGRLLSPPLVPPPAPLPAAPRVL
jgi:tellurite resistance protein